MTRKKIAIIGGGISVASLCDALAARSGLPSLDIRLAARNIERLNVIAAHCRIRVQHLHPDWELCAVESLGESINGAEIVILLIRVGGLTARARDEEFPTQFGVQGDEGLGPGGIANALRTFPVLANIAETIRRYAPECTVLNLIAPLGITTRQLLDIGLETIGVCELPSVTRSQLLTSGPEIYPPECLHYAGLNHLGWFWSSGPLGEKALEQAVAAQTVDALTFKHFGAAPLRYYYEIFDRPAAERLGLRRRLGRARELQVLSTSVLQQFAASPGTEAVGLANRPTPWFNQAVIPMVEALLGGAPYHGFCNLRNDSLLKEIPSQIVVEVAATLQKRVLHPITPEKMPLEVANFLTRMGKVEDLVYECARSRDHQLLLQALQNLPIQIRQDAISNLSQEVLHAGSFNGA